VSAPASRSGSIVPVIPPIFPSSSQNFPARPAATPAWALHWNSGDEAAAGEKCFQTTRTLPGEASAARRRTASARRHAGRVASANSTMVTRAAAGP